MSARRIALFGGSFDPPHNGHLGCIRAVLDSGMVDDLWIVPVGDERLDKRTIAAALDRLAMVEAMVAEAFPGESRVRVEPVQLEGKLPGSYTIDLLEHLEAAHPHAQFFFVIGADNVAELPKWRRSKDLIGRARFLVIERLAVSLPSTDAIIQRVGMSAPSSISSSAVRDAIRQGRPLIGLVPPSVAELIEQRALYRPG